MDDALWNLKLRSLEVSIVALADRLAALENDRILALARRVSKLERDGNLRQTDEARQQRVDKLMVEIEREPNHTDVIQPCSCDEAVALRKRLSRVEGIVTRWRNAAGPDSRHATLVAFEEALR